jgi:DNA-binding IclR family transcriptional regulator
MEIFDKAGKAVGDVVAKARERERLRIADRLQLLDRIEASARAVVMRRKHRPGYSWDMEADDEGMRMIAAAVAIDDDELRTHVDALCAIAVPYEAPDEQRQREAAELDAAYRAVVSRLGAVRRETLADD